MRGKQGDIFTTVRTEGALLPSEILRRVVEGDRTLEGLDPESYHLDKSEKINEAVNRAWFRCLGAWRTFKAAIEKLPESDIGTTTTRERWLLVLFQELGYGRLMTSKAQDIGGNTYPISHSWNHTPIHLVSFRQELDRRTPGVAGASRLSPHSLVQEFLNRSEAHLWGIVSNGLNLRILRDNLSLTRQAYVEFDLESIMEGEIYTDFVLLYLLLHQSRLEAENPEDCWLERWSKEAQERGTRALDKLRDGVEQAIIALGQGFLAHPENTALRSALKEGTLTSLGYYQQLLRLIYRFIFLFVAEDRDLIPLSDVSSDCGKRYSFYALSRLRHLAGRRRGTRHGDLYAGLLVTFVCLEKGEASLGIPALGGFIFSRKFLPDLNNCKLANDALLSAVRGLCFTEENRILRPVDYRNLGTEEMGSVYESLLELHPELNVDAFTFSLKTCAGSERKTTGSHYTHRSLIRCLLDSALEPLLIEAMKKPEPEKALLALKVADLACGSGHFLIATSHRIAKYLAVVRTGEGEPPVNVLREALRDVVANCIYGVDINPLAVELCKVSLWLESLDPRKPLGFLDHRIKCGNSIIGATPELLAKGIPDYAFKPIEGDDPAVATSIRRKNRGERQGQADLFTVSEDRSDWREAASAYATWTSLPEDNIEQVAEKARQYETLVDSSVIRHQHELADLWTAAFFWPLTTETYDTVPTQDKFRNLRDGGYVLDRKTAGQVKALAEEHRFFHWHLEFPEVFMKQQGFDCNLGNPPWERIKLQEKEYFAQRDPEIGDAPDAATRKRLISQLKKANPTLWNDFLSALRHSEGESHFIRSSGRYPYSAVGDLNTYPLFTELFVCLVKNGGYAGIICPTGLVTEKNNSSLFEYLTNSGYLRSVNDYINSNGIFQSVDRNQRFALVTLNKDTSSTDGFFVSFGQQDFEKSDQLKKIHLKRQDLEIFSPETHTCPIFNSYEDFRIAKQVYSTVGIWINDTDQQSGNPWGAEFTGMYHMTNDAHIFVPADQTTIRLNEFTTLYEAKMINIYDHRFASSGNPQAGRHIRGSSEGTTLQNYINPEHTVFSRYIVPSSDVLLRKPNPRKKWSIGIRALAGAVANVRTLVVSVLPLCGSGNSLLIFDCPDSMPSNHFSCLVCILNSYLCDYFVRQKISGININQFVLKQLPIVEPEVFNQHCPWQPHSTYTHWILPRVMELSYSAWDIYPFAEDCGYTGPPFRWDESRRFFLKCELDAAIFHIYGINRDDADYILETFPIVKRKDIAQYGEYRTKNLILEIYDAMQHAKETGQPYQTILNPPPADPRCCHQPRGDK